MADCPHCNSTGWAFRYVLSKSRCFTVLCDVHPLVEGHLLIIPKRHTSCAGEYTKEEWNDFLPLYERMSNWVLQKFGSVATFEHGKIGQTVFHSHIHILPFPQKIEQIIPEGKEKLLPLNTVEELVDVFQQDGQYLYVSIGQEKWTVDPSLGVPRFFRDRFASSLGCPERADWKATAQNPQLMAIGNEENGRCQRLFEEDFS